MVELSITGEMIADKMEFPVSIRITHGDHYFYINLDSKGYITDILHPSLVE